MLTNKNHTTRLVALGAAVLVWMVGPGCTPPGPKALVEGKKLIDASRPEEAIPQLSKAVELLPTNALAWNYLGLAHHLNGDAEKAFKAYQTALSFDHKMVAVHFNLGALYLDQGNLSGAMDELRTFTLLQPSAAEGWLKLATAYYRARRFDDADKALKSAIELQPRNPETLNMAGLIQLQRRRWHEALSNFNAAVSIETNYAPAILNVAVLHHQYLNNRPLALQNYRRYLALQPEEGVRNLVQLLESEGRPTPALNSARAAEPATNILAQLTPRPAPTLGGAPLAARPATNAPPGVPIERSNPVPGVAKSPMRSSPPEPVKPGPVAKIPETFAARSNAPVPTVTTNRTPDLQVARVREDVVVRAPQEVTRLPAPIPGRKIGGPTNTEPYNPLANEPPPRKGLLARLNPFSRSARPSNEVSRGDSPPVDAPRPAALPELAPPPSVRYTYLSPAKPAGGNREEALAAFRRGIKSQRGGDRARAIVEYQAAVALDPAYFDAYYNLGLAALDAGDARLGLWSYELALSIQPDSSDARYNFALALKTAGYPYDAADQLTRIQQENPGDVRAHLSLGNLFAQQLKQPRAAREQYLRVLELNPKHPEAATIRYWLAANP